MKRLNALSKPPIYLDRYIAIRDKKHTATRKELVKSHALIADRYESMEQAITQGTLEELEVNADALKVCKPLRACYNVVTQPLKDLKKAIRDAQPKRLLKFCPMCGTTLPSTFDHYMPAVKFPEFAVHPLNLVPCCAKCNSTKDDDWLSASEKRQFLHAYADKIPDLQFVTVTLHEDPAFDGVGATFALQRPDDIDDELWELIESHFRRLKLIDRYDERGNDEVSELLADCRIFRDSGGRNVKKFLSGQAKDRRTTYGRNHWIAVLMGEMAEHPNLLAWVSAP